MSTNQFTVRGPVSDDGMWFWYLVIGPKGGIKSEWYTKTAAAKEAKRLNLVKRKKVK